MRNILIAGSTLSLLAGAAIASAQASLPDLSASNISLRVGGVFALNGPLRNTQKLWWGVGLEYQLPKELIAGASTYFSADVVAKSGAGGHGNFFPICINEKFPFAKAAHGQNAYYFIGGGVVIMDVTATQTTGALRTGFGYNFSANTFAETSFVVSGQVSGYQATSLGLYVGYRF